MAELKAIAEALRRQRRSLDDDIENTAVRQGENTKLLDNIEKLRQRVASTREKYGITIGEEEELH